MEFWWKLDWKFSPKIKKVKKNIITKSFYEDRLTVERSNVSCNNNNNWDNNTNNNSDHNSNISNNLNDEKAVDQWNVIKQQ